MTWDATPPTKQRGSRLEGLRILMWSIVGTLAYWCLCQAVMRGGFRPWNKVILGDPADADPN